MTFFQSNIIFTWYSTCYKVFKLRLIHPSKWKQNIFSQHVSLDRFTPHYVTICFQKNLVLSSFSIMSKNSSMKNSLLFRAAWLPLSFGNGFHTDITLLIPKTVVKRSSNTYSFLSFTMSKIRVFTRSTAFAKPIHEDWSMSERNFASPKGLKFKISLEQKALGIYWPFSSLFPCYFF